MAIRMTHRLRDAAQAMIPAGLSEQRMALPEGWTEGPEPDDGPYVPEPGTVRYLVRGAQ